MKKLVEILLQPSNTKWVQEDNEKTEKEQMYFHSKELGKYYEDIKDNINRTIDLLESYKEICESLNNHHLEAQNTKTNDIVRTLTVGKYRGLKSIIGSSVNHIYSRYILGRRLWDEL